MLWAQVVSKRGRSRRLRGALAATSFSLPRSTISPRDATSRPSAEKRSRVRTVPDKEKSITPSRAQGGGVGPSQGNVILPLGYETRGRRWTAVLRFRRLRRIGRRDVRFPAARRQGSGGHRAVGQALVDLRAELVGLDVLAAVE